MVQFGSEFGKAVIIVILDANVNMAGQRARRPTEKFTVVLQFLPSDVEVVLIQTNEHVLSTRGFQELQAGIVIVIITATDENRVGRLRIIQDQNVLGQQNDHRKIKGGGGNHNHAERFLGVRDRRSVIHAG